MSERTAATRADLAALRAEARMMSDELVRMAGERDQRDREGLTAAAQRIADSVLRPLDELLGGEGGPEPEGGAEPPSVGQLALGATRLRVAGPAPAQLLEATAALQELSCRFAAADGDDALRATLTELRELEAEIEGEIRTAHDGPYLATNAGVVRDWLGRELAVPPQLALCRCGASQLKPYCDGSHARTGFSDHRSDDRVPDRRDTYVGLQVTVYDNRGICQHSGLCTDRLAGVFRADTEPFVAPSAGRMDEIVRAVRDCPSGALSYAVDGVEARDAVDWHRGRGPGIEITKDGPYRITGSLPLRDSDGADVPRAEGSSREHYALCRCGQSRNKPFCSGTHWYVDFHDPVADPDAAPTVFEWAGGLPAITRMTRLFYEKHVPEDPLLGELFGNMAADHPQRVAKWLAEVFGGPKYYSEQYGGYERMISQHLGRQISEEHRTRWVAALLASARESGLPNDPEFRSAFQSYVEWGSRLAVENSQTESHPPAHMPMPHWEWNTAAGPPGARISALAPQTEEPESDPALPGPDQPVTFAAHVKSLFRARDRRSMEFAFDLWSYDDVSANAPAILSRIRAGTMPCDGRWPSEWVDVLQRWVDTGMSP